MKTTSKDIALIGIYTAILIGGQLALSGVAGVEIVTLLLVCFCYNFGVKRSFILVNCFILIKTLWSFYPSVFVLYIIYYNLFALIFGIIGNKFNREYSVKKHIVILIVALVVSACFTLLDDVITPLFYFDDKESIKAYFYSSLPIMLVQEISVFASVLLLFKPLDNCCKLVKI